MTTTFKFAVQAQSGSDDPTTGHHYIDTVKDGKSIRLNSRDVTQATGDHSAVQIKPNKSVTGTGSITGLEVSPRFAAGMAGGDLRAIVAEPLLKAGAGNLSGSVKAVEANIDFGTSGTRTITGDVVAFETFLAVPSTYTYSGKKAVMKVRDVNIAGWDCFMKIDSTGTGITQAAAAGTGTAVYLKVYIGSTLYTIPMTPA